MPEEDKSLIKSKYTRSSPGFGSASLGKLDKDTTSVTRSNPKVWKLGKFPLFMCPTATLGRLESLGRFLKPKTVMGKQDSRVVFSFDKTAPRNCLDPLMKRPHLRGAGVPQWREKDPSQIHSSFPRLRKLPRSNLKPRAHH